MKEKISVIIPCYNRSTLIGETLENMLSQSLPPYEVIVVDDGSTDGSANIIANFGSRVKLIRQDNQGPGVARNTGFKAATGDFIQFMDSDDLASKQKLEIQLRALEASDADFAYCPWVRCNIENNKIKFLDHVLQTRAVPGKNTMLEWYLSGWSLVFQNCLFKRSLIVDTGGYRSDLMPSEDSEYFVRILLSGAKPVHTPECLIFYREHNINKITASGTSSSQRANDWTRYLNITGGLLGNKISDMHFSTKVALASHVRKHIRFCAKHGYDIPDESSPYNQIKLPFKDVLLSFFEYYQKIHKKLIGSQDYNSAFQPTKPNEHHYNMIKEIGYNPK
ncbi:glycosyltransferase family 2 protein [Flavitalea sp.]|nr:glycosyltransferase family 2 protein [Flavitalea sp.]